MNEDVKIGIAMLIFAIVVFGMGWSTGSTYMQRKAIKAGVAERVITDQITSKIDFVWKTNSVGSNVNLVPK